MTREIDVLLVNPPCAFRVADDLAPPVWALLLGALAAEAGLGAALVDLNLEVVERPEDGGPSLIDDVVDRVVALAPRLLCLSSMGVNSHVSLLLARAVRARRPEIAVILGGAHFSAIAAPVLKLSLDVDAVAVGPAETSFRALTRAMAASSRPARAILAEIADDAGAPLVDDWNSVTQARLKGYLLVRNAGRVAVVSPPPSLSAAPPEPRYDLIDLQRYFAVNPRRLLDVDAGLRGCRFRCRYCYAPAHFGAEERSEDAAVVDELARAARLGAREIFLVQDNFVNEPARTIRLCEAIRAAALGLRLQCYATLAQLTLPVIDALAGAGITGVYVGVDAVDLPSRHTWRKHLYRGEADMLERIGQLVAAGIRPTCAFMIEGPHAARARLDETVKAATSARLRGASVRLNTLAIYPGTELYDNVRSEFVLDALRPRIAMDVPDVVVDNPLAREAPELFPFHAVPRERAGGARFQLVAHALYTFCKSFPGTMAALAAVGRAWDTAEAVVADWDVEAAARMPDLDRRTYELERFAALLEAGWGGLTVAERHAEESAVLDLVGAPACLAVRVEDGRIGHLRSFEVVLAPGSGRARLIVREDDGITIDEIERDLGEALLVGSFSARDPGRALTQQEAERYLSAGLYELDTKAQHDHAR